MATVAGPGAVGTERSQPLWEPREVIVPDSRVLQESRGAAWRWGGSHRRHHQSSVESPWLQAGQQGWGGHTGPHLPVPVVLLCSRPRLAIAGGPGAHSTLALKSRLEKQLIQVGWGVD